MKRLLAVLLAVAVITATAKAVDYETVTPLKDTHRFDYITPIGDFMVKVAREADRTDTGYQTFKYGICNGLTGELVVPIQYDSIGEFNNGLAVVRKGDKFGYVNTAGQIIVPLIYDNARNFSDGLAAVGKGEWVDVEVVWHPQLIPEFEGDWGFINTNGEVIVPLGTYDWVNDFSEGFAVVRNGIGRFSSNGFINTRGEMVIPLEYSWANCFSGGLAPVRNGENKVGFINTSGEVVIDFLYWSAGFLVMDDMSPQDMQYVGFEHGYTIVQLDSKWGIIDKDGEVFVPIEYDYCFLLMQDRWHLFRDDFPQDPANSLRTDFFDQHIYSEHIGSHDNKAYFWIGNLELHGRARETPLKIVAVSGNFPDTGALPLPAAQVFAIEEVNPGTGVTAGWVIPVISAGIILFWRKKK